MAEAYQIRDYSRSENESTIEDYERRLTSAGNVTTVASQLSTMMPARKSPTIT
jgi:hypothetical protein